MWTLARLLFNPPPMPEISIPLKLNKVPGIMTTITKAFELAYYRGVLDGFVVGVILVMLVLVCMVIRKRE